MQHKRYVLPLLFQSHWARLNPRLGHLQQHHRRHPVQPARLLCPWFFRGHAALSWRVLEPLHLGSERKSSHIPRLVAHHCLCTGRHRLLLWNLIHRKRRRFNIWFCRRQLQVPLPWHELHAWRSPWQFGLVKLAQGCPVNVVEPDDAIFLEQGFHSTLRCLCRLANGRELHTVGIAGSERLPICEATILNQGKSRRRRKTTK